MMFFVAKTAEFETIRPMHSKAYGIVQLSQNTVLLCCMLMQRALSVKIKVDRF